MKAMLLAAGRGERMRPLSDYLPKPLLPVGDKPLIIHHIEALRRINITDIVINISYQAEMIRSALGDGSQFGVNIAYSYEPTVLETGGGIFQALPLLGAEPFILLSGDVWTNYPLERFKQIPVTQAHLIMVTNPLFHSKGDYALDQGKISLHGATKLTYASMAVLHPLLFRDCQPGIFPLTKVLSSAISRGEVTGEHFLGEWDNLGTVQQWQALVHRVANRKG